MKIATFNINSVRARLDNFVNWLKDTQPDVVLLQEIKCMDEVFPRNEIELLGYNIETHGQKSYNGVAIISKHSIEDVVKGLPSFEEDEQARYIEAVIGGKIRICNIYAPNGNPIDTPKFPYKIKWHQKLNEHIGEVLKYDEPLIVTGDYNVAVTDREVYNPKAYAKDAITQPESRLEFNNLKALGFTDAYRTFHDDVDDAYSYWGYRGGCWPKGYGILLDYFLLNKKAMDLLVDCDIDKEPRSKEKPSDHTPVVLELKE